MSSPRHKLIEYSLGEELFSSITHGLGSIFGVLALIYMVIISSLYGNALAIVCSAIYGSTIIILYTMSTLYHALTNKKAKIVFRVFDHSTIFLLIAGTYTPYSLISLGGILGWVIFGVVWTVAILGIVFNSISIEKFKVFSMIGYIASGWCIIVAILPMYRSLGLAGFLYLITGGIMYTVGILFYKQTHIKYMHSIWHIFVLLGSVLHFISIALYVLPKTF